MTDTDTSSLLAKVREAAEKATPGPWTAESNFPEGFDIQNAAGLYVVNRGYEGDGGIPDQRDAALIALMDPQIVSALVEVVQAVRKDPSPTTRVKDALDSLDAVVKGRTT